VKRLAMSVAILVVLATACSSGGAVGEGNATDLVTSPGPAQIISSGENLPRLRHHGEIAVTTRRGLFALNPATGRTRILAECSDPCIGITGAVWSPDGTRMAYYVQTCLGALPCEPEAGTWVREAGRPPRQLTSACKPTICVGEIWEWAPAGATLAYARTEGRASELSLLDPSNGWLTPLPHIKGEISTLDWSPDGRQIVFADGSVNDSNIALVSPDGGAARPIATGFGEVDRVAWSPDGTHIVFDSVQGGHSGIYVMRPDGSHRRKLTSGTEFEGGWGPTWSPDGTKVAFIRTPESRGSYGVEYWVTSLNGSRRILLYSSGCCPGPDFGIPVWSPSGHHIAYYVNGDWHEVRADGSGRAVPISDLIVDRWRPMRASGDNTWAFPLN
jgi:Tol biopolymer transport system component